MPDIQPGATGAVTPACLLGPSDGWPAEEMRAVERIRIHRPGVRRERLWHEVLLPDPRDPMWSGPRRLPVPMIAPAEEQPGSHTPRAAETAC
jgi:hypothetical protein